MWNVVLGLGCANRVDQRTAYLKTITTNSDKENWWHIYLLGPAAPSSGFGSVLLVCVAIVSACVRMRYASWARVRILRSASGCVGNNLCLLVVIFCIFALFSLVYTIYKHTSLLLKWRSINQVAPSSTILAAVEQEITSWKELMSLVGCFISVPSSTSFWRLWNRELRFGKSLCHLVVLFLLHQARVWRLWNRDWRVRKNRNILVVLFLLDNSTVMVDFILNFEAENSTAKTYSDKFASQFGATSRSQVLPKKLGNVSWMIMFSNWRMICSVEM